MPTLETYLGVYLWHYVPSLPAAIAFIALFALATLAHGWKMVTTRMWFCLPFVIGGIFEVIGYIARAAAYNSTGALGPYLVQAIFLLLPPILFAASLYMVYSRVVRAVHGERFSPISPRRTTIYFVLGDILCLNIQGNGSGLLAKPKTTAIGEHIIVAGLVAQVLMFVGFVFCCLAFHTRFRAHLSTTGTTSDIPWQPCLNMLYSTSVAILVRNVYRVVEFVMGKDSYLFDNEWPTYAFDGALMLLVMIGFFIWYPSQLQTSARDWMTMEITSNETGSVEDSRNQESAERPLWTSHHLWWRHNLISLREGRHKSGVTVPR